MNFAKSLNVFFIEHTWTTVPVISHIALLARDQNNRTSRLELFYQKFTLKASQIHRKDLCWSLFYKLAYNIQNLQFFFLIATLQE